MRPSVIPAKYLYLFVCCGSFRKVLNFLLNRFERRLRKVRLRSLPPIIAVDPYNSSCNLKCPGCVTGIKHPDLIKPSRLSLARFTALFDQIKDYVFCIQLFSWGEPFLNGSIFQIISHATQNRCGTTLHSNMGVFSDEMAEQLVRSKLTHLYVSIDGATQASYERYRVGGNLEEVLKNVRRLVAMKRKLRSRFPIVTWKFLVFPHNASEIELARKRAKEIGVDSFEAYSANLDNVATFGETKHFDPNSGKLTTKGPDFCVDLWSKMYLYPDGLVMPCCQSFRTVDVFGNVLADGGIREVWNNEEYMKMRRYFSRGQTNKSGVRAPCMECKIVDRFIEKTTPAASASPR